MGVLFDQLIDIFTSNEGNLRQGIGNSGNVTGIKILAQGVKKYTSRQLAHQ